MTEPYDILVVGAGPAGLSMALHARRRGMRVLVVDKGPVANHLLDFPTGMPFFTPRYSLELLGIPLDSRSLHATREELLSYYGRVARLAQLELHGDRCFERVEGEDGAFIAITRDRAGSEIRYACRKVVIAVGVFGQPRRLPAIPGVDLPKVTYLYREPFRYAGKHVLLVGAGNSSAGAALALHHAGAHVTVLDRNAEISNLKWRWHVDDLQQLLRTERIRLLPRAQLERIDEHEVTVDVAGDKRRLPNDAVIALLGYGPDTQLLARLGVAIDPATQMPDVDHRTLATRVPGIYLAGIVCAGSSPDKIFVWGARHHPKAILAHIAGEPAVEQIADLGRETIAHWRQFEKLADDVDEELALRMVPVVTGEMGEDLFDVYEHAMDSKNLYADAAMSVEGEAGAPIGSVLDALEGWLLVRNDDGSVVYKGQRLARGSFEILKRCDGTRRISDIIRELAAESAGFSEDQFRPRVLSLLVSLLRSGKLLWRAEPAQP